MSSVHLMPAIGISYITRDKSDSGTSIIGLPVPFALRSSFASMQSLITSFGLRSGNLAKLRRASPVDETILRSRRNRPETETCSNGFDQTMGGWIMLAIINLFYRQACRAALSAIRRQQQILA